VKAAAAVATVIALVFGANAVTKSESSSASTSGTQTAQAATGGQGATATPPDMGTPVTGATLTRLRAAVTAKYPGSVERAMQLSDGSYVVHVIQSNGDGELHVIVSKAFAVTGTEQGGPPAGSTAPSGTSSTTSS
jgi:hypothetical protein